MNKPNYLYGVIGMLAGLIAGYIGTNYINQTFRPPASTAARSTTLPADHPPTNGATNRATNGATNGATNPDEATNTGGGTGTDSGATGVTDAGSNGAAQSDVMAVINKARNEPDNFDAQMQAADLEKQISRYEDAIGFYERAAKARPNEGKVMVALGDANFELKRYEEAERWYQSALKQNPNDATVRNDLGLSFYLRSPRDLDGAIAAFRAALKIDPRYEKTLQNLTQALIDKGDKAGAAETLKRLEQVNPNNNAIASLRSQAQ